MSAQQQHSVWTAYLSPITSPVGAGSCMILDASGRYYVTATEAARTAANRSCVAGITLTPGGVDNRAVALQTVGPCPPSTTGLGAGAASALRVSSEGRLERVESPGPSDVVVGKCDADGWAYLNFVGAGGGGGPSPNGTDGQILTSNGSGNFGTPITPPSGALVGTTEPQTLESKTLLNPQMRAAAGAGNPAFRVDNPANTFQYQIIPDDIAADRKIQLPLLTGHDTLVTAAFPMVLSGKIINASNNTLTDTSAAEGDILVHNGTKFVRLAKGANGTFLGINGSGDVAYGTPVVAPAGSNKAIQYNNGGSLAGAAKSEINGSGEAVLGSPKLTWPAVAEGTSAVPVSGDHYISTEWLSVTTSSTSPTTLASYEMNDETLVAFDVIVTCARKTNVTKGGRYKRSVVYRRTGGGAPTIVGALESGTDQETTAGDDVTIDVSGNDVRVRVTAADSDPRNWFAEFRVQETDSA